MGGYAPQTPLNASGVSGGVANPNPNPNQGTLCRMRHSLDRNGVKNITEAICSGTRLNSELQLEPRTHNIALYD